MPPKAKASSKALRQQRRAARTSFERSGLRDAIVAAVALKIAAIVLVFDTKGLDAFDLPKTVVSHAFAWLLAGLLVTAVLRHGREIVPRTKLHFFVAAYVAAVALSAVLAANTYLALFGERDRYQGLTYVADMVVLYAAVAVAFRTVRDWSILLGVGGAAAAVSLAYAGLQLAGLDPNKWDLNAQGRPFGTFGHPDTFGELLAVALAVALGVAVFADARRPTVRIGAAIAAVLLLAGVGAVATRGSALGVVAALVAIPVVALRARRISRADLTRGLAGGAVGVFALAALVLVSPLGSRLRATVQGYAVQDRVLIYANAVSAFEDRPVLGWGPDNFSVAYVRHQQPQEVQLHGISTINTSAHDWILEAAATTGTLGLLTLVGLIGAATWLLWRGLVRLPAIVAPLALGAAAYWATALVTPNALSVDWYGWIFFGAAAALVGTQPEENAERARPAPATYAPIYLALAVGLFVAYQTSAADREALTAQLYVTAKDAATATQHAQAAVAIDPGRARYWSILGAADQIALHWRDAARAHGESTKRAPYLASYWVNLARSYAGQAASGDDAAAARTKAMDAARQGIATNPNEPVPHATLAQIATDLTDDQQLAESEIARAIALYQDDPSYYRTAVLIASKNKDPKAALAFLGSLVHWKDTALLRAGIAQAAMTSGERDIARENAQRALQLDPNNADAKAVLAALGG